MTTAPDDHFRPLPYLLSLGAIAAATAVVFFGVAFLWLTPPHPTELPADVDVPAQALELQEVPPPANPDAARGSSSTPLADKAANPTPAAMSEQEQPAAGRHRIGDSLRSTSAKHSREKGPDRFASPPSSPGET
jgi:hypothetical protein